MGLFTKKEFKHEWLKKEVDIAQLKEALEGNISIYKSPVLKKIAKKYVKFEKRGVSNLYLIKESNDEGVVSAFYAFSITEGHIDEELLNSIREVCKEKLTTGEMRASAYEEKPTEWWEKNTDSAIARVEQGKADGFIDYLVAELAPKGIIITGRQVRKVKAVGELECSATAWGIKESGLRKGVKSRFIHNDDL